MKGNSGALTSHAVWGRVSPLFLVYVALFALSGCNGESPAVKTADDVGDMPHKVRAVTVKAERIPRVVTLSGFTEPIARTSPAARTMAKVISVHVGEGERVTTGRVLARLDTRDLEARRRQAKANLEAAETALAVARTNLERMEDLHKLGILPLAKLESVEVAFAQANTAKASAAAMLDELDVNLSYAVVRAPFNGTVVRKMTEAGNLVAPGQPLFVVEDDSRLRVIAPLGADLATGLEAGQRLILEVGGETTQGVIEGIMPSGDTTAPGLRVQLIVENRGHRLRAGNLAAVHIPSPDYTTPRIALPLNAVVSRGQLTGAYVVESDNRARLRWLSLGESQGDTVEVLSGLRQGERVVLSPSCLGLIDGQRVEEVR